MSVVTVRDGNQYSDDCTENSVVTTLSQNEKNTIGRGDRQRKVLMDKENILARTPTVRPQVGEWSSIQQKNHKKGKGRGSVFEVEVQREVHRGEEKVKKGSQGSTIIKNGGLGGNGPVQPGGTNLGTLIQRGPRWREGDRGVRPGINLRASSLTSLNKSGHRTD